MVTSTGVRGLSETRRIPTTFPMSTPSRRTAAPFRKPPALSKYVFRTIFFVNQPPVPDMRKMRTASVMLARRTVRPTRSCDHFNCFWLGKFSPEQRLHRSSPPSGCREQDFAASYQTADRVFTSGVGAFQGSREQQREQIGKRPRSQGEV